MAMRHGVPVARTKAPLEPQPRRRFAPDSLATAGRVGKPVAASASGPAAGPRVPHARQACASAGGCASSPPAQRLHSGSRGRQVPLALAKAAPVAGRTPGSRRADTSNPVVAFLESIGLEHYSAMLLLERVDEMEILLALGDDDMRELGIAPAHVVHLRQQLNELQAHSDAADLRPDTESPVATFLSDVGLGQYAQVMICNGFDEMETLLEIEESDMSALGVPRGHVIKLKRKLREYADLQKSDGDNLPTVAEHQASSQVRTPQHRSGQIPARSVHSVPTGQMKSAVEQSWEQVEELGAAVVGEMLYRHTFALAPQAVELFPIHVRAKYREWSSDEVNDESDVYNSPALSKLFSRFVSTIGCAVAGMRDPRTLVPMLLQLGSRHINYGTEESHWEVVGQALQLTLRDALASAYTKEVEAAWTMMYSFISQVIIEGLRSAIALRDADLERRKAADFEPEVCSVGSTSIGHSLNSEHFVSPSSSLRTEE